MNKAVKKAVKAIKKVLPHIRIAICQMNVIPGRPDLNAAFMIEEIKKARARGVQLIVFPEMCIPGYFIGDLWENDAFIRDCLYFNSLVVQESRGIAVIWGSVAADRQRIGEDGRSRKYNAAFVAQDGNFVEGGIQDKRRGFTIKTLLPEYRIFFDERYFTSLRQEAMDMGVTVRSQLNPFKLKFGKEEVKVGVMLCEDMWHDDYTTKPAEILCEKGARLLVNLSCSPWTWMKDEKRHRVTKSLLEKCQVPLIYVNNVGVQNNGDNYIIFKVTSNVYNYEGSIRYTLPLCVAKTQDITIQSDILPGTFTNKGDSAELYEALVFAAREYYKRYAGIPIVLGLSGGIDSAVAMALWAEAIGPENVIAINMPSRFNSNLTKDAARIAAERLGIRYMVIPIQSIVDIRVHQMKEILGLELEGLNLENSQARERGAGMLCAIASALGGIVVNCSNKTEVAYGYGTRNGGDWNMGPSLLGDVFKGEVYQLARFINKNADYYIVPEEIIDMIPSAELSENQNIEEGKGDPFFYPYHDALARAFIEFRIDPGEILKWYTEGEEKLFENLRINDDLIVQFWQFFPNAKSFVKDLRHKYSLFCGAAFKRVESSPIFIVSKRAFGQDFMEFIDQSGQPYFSMMFKKLEADILAKKF